jgi:hypothetical protein
MSRNGLVLAFTHTSKPPFKKNIYFSKKIPGGMGGSPNPPIGKLGDFDKRSYIYHRNKTLLINKLTAKHHSQTRQSAYKNVDSASV